MLLTILVITGLLAACSSGELAPVEPQEVSVDEILNITWEWVELIENDPAAQTGLHQWQGREISVQADPPQPLWVEGEPFGETPFIINVVPKTINTLVLEA